MLLSFIGITYFIAQGISISTFGNTYFIALSISVSTFEADAAIRT
jgi:hypothetical protein